MLEFNFTLVIFAISFLVFINLLNLTLFKPVGNIVEARNDLIKSDLTKSSKFSKEAEETLNGYDSQIKITRIEAMKIIEESTNKAMSIKHEKINVLSESLTEEKDIAIKNIHEEQNKALAELKGKIGSLTNLITNKIIGEKNLVTN